MPLNWTDYIHNIQEKTDNSICPFDRAGNNFYDRDFSILGYDKTSSSKSP